MTQTAHKKNTRIFYQNHNFNWTTLFYLDCIVVFVCGNVFYTQWQFRVVFFSLSQTLFLSRRVCVGERDFLLSFKLVDDFVISACFHTHINTGNFIVFNFKFLFFECFVSNFAAFVAGYDTACVYHKTNRIQSKREFNSSLDETIKT